MQIMHTLRGRDVMFTVYNDKLPVHCLCAWRTMYKWVKTSLFNRLQLLTEENLNDGLGDMPLRYIMARHILIPVPFLFSHVNRNDIS